MNYFESKARLREFNYWPREIQQVSARLSRKGQAQMLDSIEQIFAKLCYKEPQEIMALEQRRLAHQMNWMTTGPQLGQS